MPDLHSAEHSVGHSAELEHDPHSADGWIVLKFGGTSVSRRHRWDTIGRLAKQRADADNARILVVVSALSGVTNELQAIADGREVEARIDALIERHRAFCAELDLGQGQRLGGRGSGRSNLAQNKRHLRTQSRMLQCLGQARHRSRTQGNGRIVPLPLWAMGGA